MDKLKVQEWIKEAVQEIMEIDIHEGVNLLAPETRICAIDLVYIVDRIEKKLGKEISSIFEINDYHVLTIDKLSDEIIRMYGGEKITA